MPPPRPRTPTRARTPPGPPPRPGSGPGPRTRRRPELGPPPGLGLGPRTLTSASGSDLPTQPPPQTQTPAHRPRRGLRPRAPLRYRRGHSARPGPRGPARRRSREPGGLPGGGGPRASTAAKRGPVGRERGLGDSAALGPRPAGCRQERFAVPLPSLLGILQVGKKRNQGQPPRGKIRSLQPLPGGEPSYSPSSPAERTLSRAGGAFR